MHGLTIHYELYSLFSQNVKSINNTLRTNKPNVELLCCTPETDIVLIVNCNRKTFSLNNNVVILEVRDY